MYSELGVSNNDYIMFSGIPGRENAAILKNNEQIFWQTPTNYNFDKFITNFANLSSAEISFSNTTGDSSVYLYTDADDLEVTFS